MSQLPSSVRKRRATPRMSRSASAAPRSPATVEKRANISVCLPASEKIAALVYLVMSWVTVKVPHAPEPFACIRRSGMTSRSKWASFSRNQTSWSSIGPRGPAVTALSLSQTGAPAAVVSGRFLWPLLSAVIPQLLVWVNFRACAGPGAVRRRRRGTSPVGRPAVGAGAPEDDLGGLDGEAVVVARGEAGGVPDGAGHVVDRAAAAAHHVV